MFVHTYEKTMDMRVFDETWYVAAFKTNKENRAEIQRWCYKTYGQSGYHPLQDHVRWKDSIQYGEIYFNNKQDLEWFVLKWSS